MAKLFVVSTPIGNLSDISPRAIEALKGADLILAEDTRQTKKLLQHYSIKTPLISYHQHSKLKKVNHILQLLQQGKALALVSDAGTPGIADPGNKLIAEILKASDAHNPNGSASRVGEKVEIIPVPGPCALTTAASVSGFPMDKFLFLGFPPVKKKRKKFFKQVINPPYPVILYESPHRILKTLAELNQESRIKNQELRVVVCRELTKLHETIYRGTPAEVIEQINNQFSKGPPKGEFVIIVKNHKTSVFSSNP